MTDQQPGVQYFTALPGRHEHITLIATWRHDIQSFSVRVCVDSIFNSNTKQWSKAESVHVGDTPNELPSVEALLDYLESRGWIDVGDIREHFPFIEQMLHSAQKQHHFN